LNASFCDAVASRRRAPCAKMSCKNAFFSVPETIQTSIEGVEVGNASKRAFVHPRKARRVIGVAGRCRKKWRGGALETCFKFIRQTTQPVRANSANSPGHPVNLSICTRLPFHLWVVSLLFCSVRWGCSAVGRNVKSVRTEKHPFFQNGSRTGRTTSARRRDTTAPRCDVDY